MSPEEIYTYHRQSYATFLNFEDTYLQDSLGTIDPGAWKDADARLRGILAAPGRRVSWKKWRSNFPNDFGVTVDQIVAQARLSSWEEDGVRWASDFAEEMRLSAH